MNAFEGVVKDFENNLTNATASFSPGSSSPTQLNQVQALQSPNADGSPWTDPLVNGPSPLEAYVDGGTTPPSGYFSFGGKPAVGLEGIPIISGTSGTSTAVTATTLTDTTKAWVVNAFVGANLVRGTSTATVTSNTATVVTFTGGWTGGTPINGAYQVSAPGNAYGPAPGRGGGNTVTSGTATPLNITPFTVSGFAGQNVVIDAGNSLAAVVAVDGQNEVFTALADVFFFNPTVTSVSEPDGTWSGALPTRCGIDTHATLKTPVPAPGYCTNNPGTLPDVPAGCFVHNFTIPIPGVATQPVTQSAVSTLQYSLTNSNGSTWQEIDASNLRVTNTPAANQSTLLTANADLFTGSAGFNQDLGIFVSDNGAADQLVAWKESGGFAGTYSPNAAYIQARYDMLTAHAYVFKLKWKTNKSAFGSTIYAGAGPGPAPWSPTSLVAKTFPPLIVPNFAVSTTQYSLANSNGSTWQNIDAVNLATTLAPASASTAVLGANADLFTGNAGYNQDIGIFVSDNRTFADGSTTSGSNAITSPASAQFVPEDVGRTITGAGIPALSKIIAVANATAATISQNATITGSSVSMTISGDSLVAWKESGGFAGTYSPNAAFVKATYAMTGGHTYIFKLKWKTNKDATGATIYAAAGPGPAPWSHTSLLAETIATGANPYTAASVAQYLLANSTGSTWNLMDSNLNVTVAPGANTNSVIGANVDLFTGAAGYNQDIGIFVSDNRTFADGSTTSGSNAITSPASAQFVPEDVGRTITGSGIPALTKIIAVANATAATISQNATITGSNVSMTVTGDSLVAWKESGGFAGTYSPNAAFSQATYHMTAGHTYIFKLKWKTNKDATGATIYAAAGPGPSPWSNTKLTVELTN